MRRSWNAQLDRAVAVLSPPTLRRKPKTPSDRSALGRADGLGRPSPARATGLTNGFVNGSGAVNGFRLSYQQRRLGEVSVSFRRKLLVIGVLVAIVVAIPYALVFTFPKQTVDIDGYFMDWVKAQIYEDVPDSPNPDIAISEYAMKYDHRGAFFYVATEGQLFSGRNDGADGFYIFIDRDNKPSSGYSVRGIGADAMVSVVGWNGSVGAAATHFFDQSASRTDFAGFKVVSTPAIAFDGSRMEIGSAVSVTESSKIAICTKHTNITGDWSDVNFRSRGTAMQVVEDHDGPAVFGVAPNQHIITLTINSKGPSAHVEALRFDFLGNATPYSLMATEGGRYLGASTDRTVILDPKLRLADGDERRVMVSAELPVSLAGSSFGLELNRTNGLVVDETNVTWTVESVQTGSRVGYILEAPTTIAIDGAFEDWATRVSIGDPLEDAYSNISGTNATGDVDISAVKTASTIDVASFYVSVNGTMLGGSSVPTSVFRTLPAPPAQNVTNITPHMFGADFAFVFIDLDWNLSTGFYIGGSEASLAIIGKGNSILSSRAYAYLFGAWVDLGPIDAAIDAWQLEMSASYSTLGLLPGMTYTLTFFAQDWSGRQDDIAVPLPARINAGMRAYPGIIINEVYNRAPPTSPNDWFEIYNTDTVPITITGWQMWVDGVLVYTFPTITLQPGEIFLVSGLNFGKGENYVLTDSSGSIIDAVSCPTWQERSWGRTGEAPYSNWTKMVPTPGAINNGQVPIPEFGDLLVPLAIVPIMMITIHRAKGRTKRA